MSSERVKVAVRIKPRGDGIFEPPEQLTAQDGYKLTIKGTEIKLADVGKKSRQFAGSFEVDDVLEGEMSQSAVWGQFEKQIMDKVFDPETGQAMFGVTLMAYGQTGAGKTYTMMGPEECKTQPLGPDGNIAEQAGICLRLCHSLFQQISINLRDKEVVTTVTVGLLELYNENMFDLLVPSPGRDFEKRVPLRLGKNRAGNFPMNQTMRTTADLEQVAAVLVEGYGNVTMGATAMNERSSRGHTIITIKATTGSEDATSLGNKVAKIQVVDLAGSERASATDAPAKKGGVEKKGTFEEAKNINKALFALGMMVEAAAKPPPSKGTDGKVFSEEKKAEKVATNIRLQANNSLLTKLLLDSIGGNVASFLILAVRDERQFFSEIKSSLEFGQKCRKVVNKPKVHKCMSHVNVYILLAQIQVERMHVI